MTRDVSFYLKQAHSRVNAGGALDADALLAEAWARPTRLGISLGGTECLGFGKFVHESAEAAKQDWELVAHLAQSKGGFAGTMLRALRSDAARGIVKGETVLLFHFAEPQSGVKQTKRTHWTAGLVADMEVWFSSLKFCGLSPAHARYGVIGYSEGEYLILSSNLQHPQVGINNVRIANRPLATNTISYIEESEGVPTVAPSSLMALESMLETQ